MSGWVGALVLLLGVLAACGVEPAASDLWGRPADSGVRSAHATITALGAGDGSSFAGDGVVVFKPRLAMSLRLATSLGVMAGELDVLQVDGVTYQRAGRDQKWARSATTAPDPTWARATDPHLVGRENVGGQDAWHLRARRGAAPVDMWVRVRDGYPLKVVTSSGSGAVFTFTYDRFNAGDQVVAPAAFAIKTVGRTLSGRVGDVLALSGARIAVLSCDENAVADGDVLQPRPGNRFVVVDVSVENTGARPLSTFLDWRLIDATGDAWAEALGIREPAFAGGELAPGETARGFLTYEVSATATRLFLTVKLDDDSASFELS